MKYSIMIFTALMIFSCCKTAQNLTLERMDHNGNNLRIDGYYYHQLGEVFHPFILFENGAYHSMGLTEQISIERLDSLLQNKKFYDNISRIQYTWGVYKVLDNKIEIERWLPGTGGPYPVQLIEGEILDDETILISGLRGTKYEDEVDEFKFRHLSPKPDSTNVFIK